MRIADRWFERTRVDDDITLIWEPHVDPLMRCNIWHVRGRDRDMLVDTGMGVGKLREAVEDLIGKTVVAVVTHSHPDHSGSLHEFDVRAVHRLEAADLERGGGGDLDLRQWPPAVVRGIEEAGYVLENDILVNAVPEAGFDVEGFAIQATSPTWLLDEGDAIDLGNRRFEVLHLPGHSPGSIGLWEAGTGTLFSGDAIYDGPLLDRLPDSDITDYVRTMERLRELPATVVHGGHDPSFGRERLVELADAYLASRG